MAAGQMAQKPALDEVVGTLLSWSVEGPPSNPRKAFASLAAQLKEACAESLEALAAAAPLRGQVDTLQEHVSNLTQANSKLEGEASTASQEAAIAAAAFREKEDALHEQVNELMKAKAKLEGELWTEQQAREGLAASLEEASKASQDALAATAALREEGIALREQVSNLTQANAKLETDLSGEQQARAELTASLEVSNVILSPVSTMCRTRPVTSYKDKGGEAVAVRGEAGEIAVEDIAGRSRRFKVDRVLDGQASQEDVFKAAAPWVENVVVGRSSCVFAYGATGAGKTHTMLGGGIRDDDVPGLAHHALRRLIEGPGGGSVRVSMMEVYCDHVRDLLAEPAEAGAPPTLQVARRDGQGRMVLGCAEPVINSFSKAVELLQRGFANRATEGTRCNERSSRSHVVLTVQGLRSLPASATSELCAETSAANSGMTLTGRLTLVDLAGSENIQRSGADEGGKLLAEAKAINKSLSALADVVEALAKQQPFVPYRNTRLTMLLEDVLATSKVLMLVHVSPHAEDATDSSNSLQFASRVRAVDFGAQRLRQDAEERLRASQQREQDKSRQLQAHVDALRKDKEDQEKEAKEFKRQVAQLQEQIRRLERGALSRTSSAEPIPSGRPPTYPSSSTTCLPAPTAAETPGRPRSSSPAVPQQLLPRPTLVRARRTAGSTPTLRRTAEVKQEVTSEVATTPAATVKGRMVFGDLTNSRAANWSKADSITSPSTTSVDTLPLPVKSTNCMTTTVDAVAPLPQQHGDEGQEAPCSPAPEAPNEVEQTTPVVPLCLRSALARSSSTSETRGETRRVKFEGEPELHSPPKWYVEYLEATALTFAQRLEEEGHSSRSSGSRLPTPPPNKQRPPSNINSGEVSAVQRQGSRACAGDTTLPRWKS